MWGVEKRRALIGLRERSPRLDDPPHALDGADSDLNMHRLHDSCVQGQQVDLLDFSCIFKMKRDLVFVKEWASDADFSPISNIPGFSFDSALHCMYGYLA